MTRFERDSAVAIAADGAFDARIDRGWWVVMGANGGYVASIVLRALIAAVDDAERTPRSLTIHYVSPASEGPVRVHVRQERSGRSLSALSARLEQDGRLVALALASFGRARDSLEFQDLHMPEVASPEKLAVLSPTGERMVPMRERFETRPAFGAIGPGTSSRALVGGWLRLAEPFVPDAPALAMFCDAWWPAVMQRQVSGDHSVRGVPTIDLSVHFRAPLPANARPEDSYLCVFRSQIARDGYVEEDGEIWTRDGTLLAQSRQLALLT